MDVVSEQILNVFALANRERRYVDGVALPIATSDVSAVVAVRPVNIPRCLLDDAVFAVDELWLKSVQELQNRK